MYLKNEDEYLKMYLFSNIPYDNNLVKLIFKPNLYLKEGICTLFLPKFGKFSKKFKIGYTLSSLLLTTDNFEYFHCKCAMKKVLSNYFYRQVTINLFLAGKNYESSFWVGPIYIFIYLMSESLYNMFIVGSYGNDPIHLILPYFANS